mmetsp:Transcript_176939/g.567463  ORF Transcript_176939/g.567463 Transcript_176939/m.567463 type:complete len:213 (-) Transcript_176939:177-815(-)
MRRSRNGADSFARTAPRARAGDVVRTDPEEVSGVGSQPGYAGIPSQALERLHIRLHRGALYKARPFLALGEGTRDRQDLRLDLGGVARHWLGAFVHVERPRHLHPRASSGLHPGRRWCSRQRRQRQKGRRDRTPRPDTRSVGASDTSNVKARWLQRVRAAAEFRRALRPTCCPEFGGVGLLRPLEDCRFVPENRRPCGRHRLAPLKSGRLVA